MTELEIIEINKYNVTAFFHFRNGQIIKHVFRGCYRNPGQSWFEKRHQEWKSSGLIPISSNVSDGYMPYHALDKITFEKTRDLTK